MRVATLNVWFHDKLRVPRTTALVEIIKELGVDVICLQEVVPDVAAQIVSSLVGWPCSDPGDGSSVTPYGVMCLAAPGKQVRFVLHDLPSEMYRKLLITEIDGIAVGTVHLESLANHPTREAQLQVCNKHLEGYKDALLVGDFNFDSEQNFAPPHSPLENDSLAWFMPDFVDVWPSLRTDRGLTFDSTINPYVGKRSEKMRYDRVMCKLAAWRAATIDRFGHEPADRLVQLNPWDQEYANRPPTPPRPQPRPLAAPVGGFDEWLDTGTPFALPLETSIAMTTTPPRSRTPRSPDTHTSALRVSTPPRSKSNFYLSDHFGLHVLLEPVDSPAA